MARLEFQSSFKNINQKEWNDLTKSNPFLRLEFFQSLEASKSIGEGTGWHPFPAIVIDQGSLVGASPIFLKEHSYGEYVFDWSWAEAYQKYGKNYYPKIASCIPFTPATGPRIFGLDLSIKKNIVVQIEKLAYENKMSSSHILFCNESEKDVFGDPKWMLREGVQFKWFNKNYNNFPEFLSQLSHDKRKKIKQERKKIYDLGLKIKKIKGTEISESDLDFFYACYCNTYQDHHSHPYLTRIFFSLIKESMPENLLLILAYEGDLPVAASFFFYDDKNLYGRYWGSKSFYPGLHFELSYYQGQEFCIENRIVSFEGGAQGEHKLARGFEPFNTFSFHRIFDEKFELAIKDFLRREKTGIDQYTNELNERAPYKTELNI
ncbi:N-acetyltransferase [Candidatus Methylopumilus universalis]|uniref:N-acetyltransferase n=1 Tax=Candidatus Methylopumilus universalis TaxID=2588536 RepID=A0AAX1F0G2_9PROT|nr:GNAT family N-acetyltransferase [Candidatus Methylopumilus universalis]QDC41401.1 N-acetyltransferase [Candidatus Methylopumilus universalis]QDC42683.1 N-acetyltransferase [Candidatus Methylopumilus universalis]QDC55070.1 N-acetyltransferase [Candidatus Methylopumilus universalis]QDC56351.1 N-acetyltransferase [Candidatus Methylopumilus universalis]QDC57640.1 N-acetyltransferase [Candidatus Methylopumilus universalis]